MYDRGLVVRAGIFVGRIGYVVMVGHIELGRVVRSSLSVKEYHWAGKCHPSCPEETERPAAISQFGCNRWLRLALAFGIGLIPLAVQH